jgi:hypothetical protein
LVGSSGYVRLAHGYPFRTEQAGVARLKNAAAKVDSTAGTLDVSGFEILPDPTTMTGCLVARAGDGFVTTTAPDAAVLATHRFTVIPSIPDLDAVIGVSAAPPASFSDLAAAVRLAPNGLIDVRDGDGYRADAAVMYRTTSHALQLIADVTSHTYSVFDRGSELARQYGFRTQQRAVTHLQTVSVIVDGTEGSVAVCDLRSRASRGVVYSREGAYSIVPLANDSALLGGSTAVSRVDAYGRTVAQLATTQLSAGGQIAADAAGNVFVAAVDLTTLTIDKYDPSFIRRWHVDRPLPTFATIQAIASDSCGAVVVALDIAGDPSFTVLRFTADGAFASQASIPRGLVTLDGDQPIVVQDENTALRVTRFAATGEVLWSRTFAGHAEVTAVAVDPLHDVLLGGTLGTEMNFGGGPLPILEDPDTGQHAFLVKLSAGGDHVFSTLTHTTWVSGIASNGARIVVSAAVVSRAEQELVRPRLLAYDAAGTPIPMTAFDSSFDTDLSGGVAVAIGASGRIWWNLHFRQAPSFGDQFYLVALRE